MLARVRRWIHTANGAVGIIGGIASVVIAWYAIQIQTHLHEAEVAREIREHEIAQANMKADKAIALFERFSASASLNELAKISTLVEHEMHIEEPDYENTDNIKSITSKLLALRTLNDDSFYDHVIHLLSQVSMIARCADLNQALGKELCDKATVLALMGDSLTELFFKIRPVLYCDGFVERFKHEREEFESIVKAHLEARKDGRHIYAKREDVPIEEKKNGVYIVLEFGPKSYCKPFSRAADTTSPARPSGAG